MNQALPPPVHVLQMIFGRPVSQAITVAAKLGIADQLANGPKPAEDLAKRLGAHGESLHRLLRMLASVGIFTEQDPGRFANTPMSETLRRDAPGSLRSMAMLVNHSANIKAWLHVEDCVTSGGSGWVRAHG